LSWRRDYERDLGGIVVADLDDLQRKGFDVDKAEFQTRYGKHTVWDPVKHLVTETAWDVVRQREAQRLYAHIVEDLRSWLCQGNRQQVMELYLGCGDLDGDGLTFPEINVRLGITNAKDVWKTIIRKFRTLHKGGALDDQYTNLVTATAADDQRWSWALMITQADTCGHAEPPRPEAALTP
jgi:hypothetical protein